MNYNLLWLMGTSNEWLITLVLIIFLITFVAFFFRVFKQPYLLGYIIAGILIGKSGFGLVESSELGTHLGEIGVILLLFFIGMEISLPKIIANWRVPVLGTIFQILGSLAVSWLIAYGLGWPIGRTVFFGFAISLSSTAVVINVLERSKELNTKVGQNVLGILIVQDILIVPMMIILGLLGGDKIDTGHLLLQIGGGIGMILFVIYILKKRKLHLPFTELVKNDHEIQVFYATILCMGFALISAVLGLSAALGAFVAGIVVAEAKETKWIHNSLHSFKVFFVALFFISVGLSLDLLFFKENILAIVSVTLGVLFTNTFINAAIMRFLKETWKESIYSGAILAQIGEFSFVLGTVAVQSGIIQAYAAQTMICVISLSIFLSPFWITGVKKMVQYERKKPKVRLS